jgi:hypothetical protein
MLGDEGLPLNAVMAKGATSDLRHEIRTRNWVFHLVTPKKIEVGKI